MAHASTDLGATPRKRADDGSTAAPTYSPWAMRALVVMPPAAALTIWLSLHPGAPGQPYLYRVLIAVFALPGLFGLARSRAWSRTPAMALVIAAAVTIPLAPMSLLWATSSPTSVQQAVATSLGALGAMAALGLSQGDVRLVDAWRRGYLVAAICVLGIGVWEMATGTHLEDLGGRPWGYGDSIGGPFINPNNFACFLLFLLGPLLTIAGRATTPAKRMAMALIIALTLVEMATTQSRSAVLGAAIVGIALLSGALRGSFRGHGGTLLIAAQFALVPVVVWWDSVSAALRTPFRADDVTSDNERAALRDVALRYFSESDGLGIGVGSFEPRLTSEGGIGIGRSTNVHNSFLEILAELGLPVALPLAVFLLTAFVYATTSRGANKANRARDVRTELLIVLAGLSAGAYSASSLTADSSWWLMLAYAAALIWTTVTTRAANPVDGALPSTGTQIAS